ncbi:PREDICTED: UDP-glycosyltransferase 79B30-like [Nelumbo nucifera]|uniref:Glycosyltransferase n=2 Tax=Nelumbo nucifera TaxID=4432 RepID=A0A822XUG9_NELNU|nr:PREDICTED: UDP-glycosyltransferase 79B30-like [Nelumbo nucifera]DAD21088.1 TPA_asm: hypothetical protein HUJ06_022551 [Nelumbo nucifera]
MCSTESESGNERSTFHAAMYPWFAIGHIVPFLHLSNKLAENGHRVSFLLPPKTQSKLQHLNRYPDLIRFIPIAIPPVDGLPPTAETTADVSRPIMPLLVDAMNLTKDQVEAALRNIKPDFVFFDFSYWLPPLARQLGIKSILYCVISPASTSYLLVPARKPDGIEQLTEEELMQPPPGYPPDSPIRLCRHESRSLLFAFQKFSRTATGLTFYDRQTTSMRECDALCFRTYREMEGPYCDYMGSQYGKPVLLTGPILPEKEKSTTVLDDDEHWCTWSSKWRLGNFKAGSVVYCAFGSECVFTKEKVQELVLGLELTGLPFLVALKPPHGAWTVEEALPDGFRERVEGRGVVYGGWVPQQQILSHLSVGCFVSHCGYGSMWESLVSNCQMVLLPNYGDQIKNAKLLARGMKVAVEVERREDDGWFTRESVCRAVKLVMDDDSHIGRQVKANHAKWRSFLLEESLQRSYTDAFIRDLKALIN